MSIVDPKYRRLYAKQTYLSAEVVLVQAWKKAQRYIRRSNWYADLLELDQSAVQIEALVKRWKDELEHGQAYPRSMRLVPAPKAHRWGFEKRKWCEIEKGIDEQTNKKKRKPIPFRPLAHLGIREQALATAAMLCLADCVETAQGDTDITDYFEARRRRIHSYGNRLFCRYDADTTGKPERPRPLAQFGWGNSETYRKYYVDYQRFLERPRIIAANVQDQLGRDEELFVVKLDLSAFYDLIDRSTLIERLKAEYEDFVASYTLSDGAADNAFWDSLAVIMDWKWDSEDIKLKDLLKQLCLPDGLPQGLVASGFFANAYLLDFDRCISSLLKRRLDQGEVKKALPTIHSVTGWNRSATLKDTLPDLPAVTIHDYCRYVDDIRLVVSVRGDGEEREKLGDLIVDWVNYWLDAAANPGKNTHRLQINKAKTEVTPFRLIDGQVGVTSRMALIQGDLSGPVDMDALEQVTVGLDGLLTLADQFDRCDKEPGNQPTHPLAQITAPKSEIRDDTLKRFAASRLVKVLRQRRSMTDLQAETEPGLTRGEAIDHEIEMFARKLVGAWTHDPSLCLVLRYGMDLYPSPALFRPVVDALRELITGRDSRRARVGWYVCADLMKAGATETGMRARDLEVPDAADLNGYRALLLELAKDVLDKKTLGRNAPWYAQQQALLLLAVLEPCPAHIKIPLGKEPELTRYFKLLQLAVYPHWTALDSDELVLSLVNQQLHPSPDRFATWLISLLAKINENERLERLKTLGFTRPDLMARLLEKLDEQEPSWIDGRHRYLKIPKGMLHDSRKLEDFDREYGALWNIFTRTDNPFRQELFWLKLAHTLIQKVQLPDNGGLTPETFSLHAVTIKAKNWRRLGRPELDAGGLQVQFKPDVMKDPRLETPKWCVEEGKWFYALGRLLRSAISGEEDFTLTPYLHRHDWDGYAGMRNSWYTRAIGMIHAPEQLGGEAAPFSPWVSELLMRLLQWPGMGMTESLIDNWDAVETLDHLDALVRNRLRVLEGMYGRASELPVYPIRIGRDLSRDGRWIRVVLAQTLRPLSTDFCKADPCLNNAVFRAQHRRHLSALCRLIRIQLEAQCSAEEKAVGQNEKACADLIVLPELSVHPDDVWILQRLSDKTKAMLFFGLTPMEKQGIGLVNTARWLIPNQTATGRSWIVRDQGKHHPTADEERLGLKGWRPYQVVIELPCAPSAERGFRLSGTICYDATDLNLAADMRNVSDLFVISALNKDISTFDNMVAALHYHMFQHLVLVNSGEFGGSTVQAPFKERYNKLISHHHGGNQIGIGIFDVNLEDFGPMATTTKQHREKKTKPAGFRRFK